MLMTEIGPSSQSGTIHISSQNTSNLFEQRTFHNKEKPPTNYPGLSFWNRFPPTSSLNPTTTNPTEAFPEKYGWDSFELLSV